jgi:hypothetical protein
LVTEGFFETIEVILVILGIVLGISAQRAGFGQEIRVIVLALVVVIGMAGLLMLSQLIDIFVNTPMLPLKAVILLGPITLVWSVIALLYRRTIQDAIAGIVLLAYGGFLALLIYQFTQMD